MFEHFERDARLVMRACVVRGILLDRVFNHQTITYQELGEILKTIPGGGELAQALSIITTDEAAHRQPLSVAIVVNSRTGVPGQGFFDQCRELGLLGPKRPLELPRDEAQEPAEIELIQDTKSLAEKRRTLFGYVTLQGDARYQEPLTDEEKEFWLQHVQSLGVGVALYWDREIAAQLGAASAIVQELPPNLWDTEGSVFPKRIDVTNGPPLEAPTFRINRKVEPPPTNQPKQPLRCPREIVAASKWVRIPAHLLRKGDTVMVKKDEPTKGVKWAGLDPPSAAQGGYEQFVHWISTDGERYRESQMGSLKILTPPDILQRLDPREPGLPTYTPVDPTQA